MLHYNRSFKPLARGLRSNMTESERRLWSKLRRKQIVGVQFYRQKTIGCYIIDFYAPKTKLVIEVDGSQHMEEKNGKDDAKRDGYLKDLGLSILRFDNLQVLQDTEAVMEVVLRAIKRT